MKRLIDSVLSILLLVLFLPVMLATALAVLMSLGRPIFFRQDRPGLNSVPFRLIKFRTMSVPHQTGGVVSLDENRLGNTGRWLRESSLDELPELWNVFKGDMSLVGPRPLLMEYLDLYSPEQARRHDVRPGITGRAQVSGRNAISWEEKFDLDVWYVDNQSTILDLKILLKTVINVLKRDGISQEGQATMQKFTGTKS